MKRIFTVFASCVYLALLVVPVAASLEPGGYDTKRADSHAPLGVMRDHTHEENEVMFSYRYMFMDMDQLYKGDDKITEEEAHADFMITPTNMKMEMHTFGVMYAPKDWLTLAVMLPYVRKQMDHIRRDGQNFQTKSEGFGDVKVSAMIPVWEHGSHRAHIMWGHSFPSGSIDERDDTLAGANQKLPYPMQIGSGTYDLLPGITYLGQHNRWSWGAQANGTIRLGENDDDYTLGDRAGVTGWLGYAATDNVSLSLRSDWQSWGDIDGADPEIGSVLAPMGRTDLQGGDRLDIGFGLNLYANEGFFKGHRIATEFLLPVYQDLDGPQLGASYQLIVGWQYAF